MTSLKRLTLEARVADDRIAEAEQIRLSARSLVKQLGEIGDHRCFRLWMIEALAEALIEGFEADETFIAAFISAKREAKRAL